MVKIKYFHGLGGGHSSLLSLLGAVSDFEIIQKPTDFYREWDKDLGKSYFDSLKDIKADIALGISFGGYVAYHYAKMHGIPCFLINPALDRDLSKTGIDWMDFRYKEKKSDLTVYLGQMDDCVPNYYTTNYLENKNAKIYSIPRMGHSPDIEEWLHIWANIKLNLNK